MIEAFMVILVGAGFMGLGVLESTMYDIGVVVILLGLIGVVVRALDVLSWIWPRHGAGSDSR